jgi:Mn2+/Fe2+ NRAMP family transporter
MHETRERRPESSGSRWRAFGPGVLFAGIAVGASHLVQSTRAGADFGFALILVIIVTNIAKYPAFRFGAQYAGATGTTLLRGFRHQGRWAIYLYGLIAIGTMFAAVPAVTLVTAGLAQSVFGLTQPTLAVCAMILIACVILLIVGGYKLLDKLVKVVMSLLVVSTLVATVLVIPSIDWQVSGSLILPDMNATNVFYIAALIGLMPVSVDISVWYSLWSVEKSKTSGHQATVQETLWDFNVGYVGTIVLALCFVILGAGTMHGKDLSFAPSAEGFAEQLINMYVQTLGTWSAPLIGASAFCVMLSTVVTGIDGYPRVAVELARIARQHDSGADNEPISPAAAKRLYAGALTILAGGSFVVLYFFLTALRVFIDVAATIAFLCGPLIAWLNHRSIMSPHVPEAMRPSRRLQVLSMCGIALLSAIAVYYLYLKFTQ